MSCRMPSDIMDHMSSFYKPSVPSSFFSEEFRFPSEKQVGFWKSGSVPDHRGLETTSFMPGGKVVSSSPLEKFQPMGGNFVDSLELQQSYVFKDPKRNISFEHHLTGTESNANCWRAPGQDIGSLSRLYGLPTKQSVEATKVATNEDKNGFFSNSLSDMVDQKLRLSSSDVCVDRSVKIAQPNFVDHEAFESSEEIEAQTIGDLLPDDDDLFSGALHGLGYVPSTNRTDVEDDLFCSVGGLELESDNNFGPKKASEVVDGEFNGQMGRFGNFSSSEFPCGERPSRTLFVKNINGIEDLELRLLFEQFGELQALFTACRLRGFILVSFYDVRAAQNAIKVLQTTSIRHQKLDMHFCVPMDNPSEKDVNLGALVVINLDTSISNDDLLQIFSVYGQIKEICDIPHKRHKKFVEYYDIRAAEAAFSALNMLDIAGKRIKIEPCCPGDSILGSSSRRLDLDSEEKQLNACRGESFGVHNTAMHEMFSAFGMPNGSSFETKFHPSRPHSVSSPARVAMMGSRFNQSDDYELSHSLGQRNVGFQSMSTFTDFHDGTMTGLSFNSPNTMSAMAMNISSSLANGIDNKNIGRAGTVINNNHSFEPKESAYGGLGNGSSTLHGHEYIWNHSNSYRQPHPGSLVWQNMSPFMNSFPAQISQMHGLGRAPGCMPNPVLPLHQHVGSAPVVDPALFEGRHSYTGDAAAFHPASLGSIGYSSFSPVQSSHNIFPHAGGNCIDPSLISSHVGIHSPQQRGHMLHGRNNGNLMSASHDVPNDRIRSRRSDSSANQADNRKQYELDVERIIRGEDSRTTLMIKNIPNKYTSKMLLATIDEQHKGTYDFIYLPIDFKNKCNVGYAFINMTDPQHIIPFYQAFDGKKWEKFNSEKVASLAYARIQGKPALVAHFQNSSLMNEDKRCRPILFHSDGPNAGDQEPFPVGLNIRSRRSKTNTENHQGSPSGSSSGEESANLPGSPTSGCTKELSDRANF